MDSTHGITEEVRTITLKDVRVTLHSEGNTPIVIERATANVVVTVTHNYYQGYNMGDTVRWDFTIEHQGTRYIDHSSLHTGHRYTIDIDGMPNCPRVTFYTYVPLYVGDVVFYVFVFSGVGGSK